jgi:hypothetical protein
VRWLREEVAQRRGGSENRWLREQVAQRTGGSENRWLREEMYERGRVGLKRDASALHSLVERERTWSDVRMVRKLKGHYDVGQFF